MLRWATRFWAYPASRKLMFLEAGILCIVAKLMVIGLPFRITQKLLNFKTYHANTLYTEGVLENSLIVRTVFQTVDSISRHVFWTNTCLVRSITVKILLRRRNIDAILYLGLAKDDKGQLKAHAWVKALDSGMVYDDGSGEYTTVAVLV